VINAIKRSNKAAHVTWVLQPAPASLVAEHPLVDEIIIFDRRNKLRAFRDVIGQLRSRHFDLLIDLQVYFKAGLLTGFSGASRRIGFDRARARDANWLFTTERIPVHPVQHVQDQYFEFLKHLGIDPEPVRWDLGPTDTEREWQREFISQFDRPIAPIVVATSKPAKDWIPERWAQVADILYEQYGLMPVLVGGTSERERNAERIILEKARHKPHSALGSGLRRLVSIIDAGALVLSPDTGPLHITVALDRPVISLMGFTDPLRSGPYTKFRDLIIDGFHDPDEKPSSATRHNRPDRMHRIEVEDVAGKIALWNERYRGKS
jgi:heptosyltransferase I